MRWPGRCRPMTMEAAVRADRTTGRRKRGRRYHRPAERVNRNSFYGASPDEQAPRRRLVSRNLAPQSIRERRKCSSGMIPARVCPGGDTAVPPD